MAPDGNFNLFDIDAQPFDPVKFFAGSFQAQGMFVDRFGHVQKRFLIDFLDFQPQNPSIFGSNLDAFCHQVQI